MSTEKITALNQMVDYWKAEGLWEEFDRPMKNQMRWWLLVVFIIPRSASAQSVRPMTDLVLRRTLFDALDSESEGSSDVEPGFLSGRGSSFKDSSVRGSSSKDSSMKGSSPQDRAVKGSSFKDSRNFAGFRSGFLASSGQKRKNDGDAQKQ